jgi:hypothetical protein
MYGLYDMDDNLWMGTDAGPLLYEDEMIARVSAMIVDKSLHQRVARTRAKLFNGDWVKLRDSKPLLESAVEALDKLEMGCF